MFAEPCFGIYSEDYWSVNVQIETDCETAFDQYLNEFMHELLLFMVKLSRSSPNIYWEAKSQDFESRSAMSPQSGIKLTNFILMRSSEAGSLHSKLNRSTALQKELLIT